MAKAYSTVLEVYSLHQCILYRHASCKYVLLLRSTIIIASISISSVLVSIMHSLTNAVLVSVMHSLTDAVLVSVMHSLTDAVLVSVMQ